MELEIFWSEFAKLKLKEIYQYYKLKANKRIAIKIADGIIDQTTNLGGNLKIGQIEGALNDEHREFRYLIYTKDNLLHQRKNTQRRNSERI